MISEKLHNAINEQINAELWSAYLYLSMSLDAEAKGHKGVANWFFIQFKEEQDHARIFMNTFFEEEPQPAEKQTTESGVVNIEDEPSHWLCRR